MIGFHPKGARSATSNIQRQWALRLRLLRSIAANI
jgi:hypothetical protein